jgi:hypothetical protein
MTPQQIRQCCIDGSCKDGGLDLANGKTIVCDPAKGVGPGDESY